MTGFGNGAATGFGAGAYSFCLIGSGCFKDFFSDFAFTGSDSTGLVFDGIATFYGAGFIGDSSFIIALTGSGAFLDSFNGVALIGAAAFSYFSDLAAALALAFASSFGIGAYPACFSLFSVAFCSDS